MKNLITTFGVLLVLVVSQNPAVAVIGFEGLHNMVNETMVWLGPDVSVVERDFFGELGPCTSDLIIDIPEARTHTNLIGALEASDSAFTIEFHCSFDMEQYLPVYQDRVEVSASTSAMFTISEPCNYQVNCSRTGSIGGAVTMIRMGTAEFFELSSDEDEFSTSGQIVEPGTYFIMGGIKQVGFPENESYIAGEYQFDFRLEEESAVATDTKSWDGIKSLYR